MTFLDAVILGIIQGLTEFLPVSSSGHLVIGETLLGLKSPGLSFDVWLHFGTLLAVLVYFYRRLLNIFRTAINGVNPEETSVNRRLLGALAVGTIPAVIGGWLLKSVIESVFDLPWFAALMLIITGLILLATHWATGADRNVDLPRGLTIGMAQLAAILPGISRSGSTIACAMFLGVEPAVAAEFSFLLAAPIIALVFVYNLITSGGVLLASNEIWTYLAGTAVSFMVGMLAIHFLLKIVRTGKFYLFGFYCLVAGVISFILLI
jgi:undecaprenyl-diphosphatase